MYIEHLQESLGRDYAISCGRGTYFVKIYDCRDMHLVANITPSNVHIDPSGLSKDQYRGILIFVKHYLYNVL